MSIKPLNIKQVFPNNWPSNWTSLWPFEWPFAWPSNRTDTSQKTVRCVVQKPFAMEIGVRALLKEDLFHLLLSRELSRTQRSDRAIVLVLARFHTGADDRTMQRLAAMMSSCIRQTDSIGWYETGGTLGLLFTQIEFADQKLAAALLGSRVAKSMRVVPDLPEFRQSVMIYSRNDRWRDWDNLGPCASRSSRRSASVPGA
jgi:hypothetical protein